MPNPGTNFDLTVWVLSIFTDLQKLRWEVMYSKVLKLEILRRDNYKRSVAASQELCYADILAIEAFLQHGPSYKLHATMTTTELGKISVQKN